MTMQTRARSTADRLFARYGGAMSPVRLEGGTPPQNPWDPPGEQEQVLYPVQIIETGYQQDYHAGTLIQAGDRLGMMAVPASVTPVLSDRLRIDGDDYMLLELRPVQPAPDGETVAYAYQARR